MMLPLRKTRIRSARRIIQGDKKLPRNRSEFDELLARYKREFYGVAYDLSVAVSAALETAGRLYSRIMRGNPTPARAAAVNDIRAQFTALINPRFVNDAGAEYLLRYPKYMQALELRLEKLEANLQRDTKRVAEIAPFWRKCVAAFAKCRAAGVRPAENLTRFRWLLEEYRIVLFAQEVGACEPVSREKLAALATEL